MATLGVETQVKIENDTYTKIGMTQPLSMEVGHSQLALAGGVTPLMQACQQEKEIAVRQLIHRDASSVRSRDRTGKTALHYCVENTNLSCLDQLLNAEPTLISARDEEGYTGLHLATIAGNRAVVRHLLSNGSDIHATDDEEHTAVHWATVCGEVEILDLLLDAGGELETPDIHGAYPIHYAAQMCGPNSELGHEVHVGLQVLQKLLQRGASVSVTDHDGRQPLLWAASAEVRPSHVYCPSGSADAILALINAGADVAAEDKDGLTALHCAASRGHLDCLDVLITLCSAEVDTLDSNGCTPLFYSTTLGHADCTELLLNHGANPDRQDRKGRTPAHCGAAKGQLETLKMLHRREADLWKRNVKGDLPLHEACQSGRKDLILWLLSLMPEAVNIPNNDGRCPLHIAAINNNVETCKILMDYKATVNPIMRNSRGQLLTPVDAAVARGNRGCAKYLQLHGGLPASKLTDKRALQIAMQKALEAGPVIGHTGATPSDLTGGELTASSTPNLTKSPSMTTLDPSFLSPHDQPGPVSGDEGDKQNNSSSELPPGTDAEDSQADKNALSDDPQAGEGDEKDTKENSGEDSSSNEDNNEETKLGKKKKTKKRNKAENGESGGDISNEGTSSSDNSDDADDEEGNERSKRKRLNRLSREERIAQRLSRGSDLESGEELTTDSDEENGSGDERIGNRTATLKKGGEGGKEVRMKYYKSKKTTKSKNKKDAMKRVMSGGPSKVEAMDNNLQNNPATEMSITRAMQTTLRKYSMERRLFQQLLDLKRMQIRNSRANEHVIIKRLADEYNKEVRHLGLKDYSGPLNFSSYEKYLYDQLQVLQSTDMNRMPRFRSNDDVDKLARALRKSNAPDYGRTLNDKEKTAQNCNRTTHRCHHAIHAYTGVPCAAYLAQYKRNVKEGKIPVNLPKLPPPVSLGSEDAKTEAKKPLKVELQHGKAKQQISLPTNFLDKSQKYQLTVSIQPSAKSSGRQESSSEKTDDLLTAEANNNPSSARSAPDISESSAQDAPPPKDVHSAPTDGTRTSPQDN